MVARQDVPNGGSVRWLQHTGRLAGTDQFVKGSDSRLFPPRFRYGPEGSQRMHEQEPNLP